MFKPPLNSRPVYSFMYRYILTSKNVNNDRTREVSVLQKSNNNKYVFKEKDHHHHFKNNNFNFLCLIILDFSSNFWYLFNVVVVVEVSRFKTSKETQTHNNLIISMCPISTDLDILYWNIWQLKCFLNSLFNI